ncbi:hypothetical protein I6J24_03320 [Corynebacterium kroppenstedtii]|nr:hypothetical protein [Corynebacterium pseudokroppenstedtii]MCF6792713.1 hypothetical protein [Corynebacterium pseudokroppenstedtii]MCF8702654.1 hypothetical protein [Corynebacterium pseudokroppenstedtii]MDK7148041.1 hypothetical protein [Corynebacterium pseudokroppenstedtii]QRP15049.1 hypothetical protein I6J24_03320 [Corynebacterium kroppenstedtii]
MTSSGQTVLATEFSSTLVVWSGKVRAASATALYLFIQWTEGLPNVGEL